MNEREEIADFWEWFSFELDRPRLKMAQDSKEYRALVTKVIELGLGIVVDVRQEKGKKKELVVSANGDKAKMATVITMVDEAPTLKYWKVTAFKQPQEGHINIVFEGIRVETTDAFYEVVKVKEDKVLLNIWFITPQFDWRFEQIAQVMLTARLGEYLAAMRVEMVGVFQVDQERDYQGRLLPLVEIGKDERVVGTGNN
jgi:hypothetical protein